MNKAKLKTYAPQARKDFIAAVTARAHRLGLADNNGQLQIAPAEKSGDLVIIAGQSWPAKISRQRDNLIALIQKHGFAQTMENVAYTWFNRFAALRYMEIHDYLNHGYRVLSNRAGGLPEILGSAPELAQHGDLPGLNPERAIELKLAGDQDGELYRLTLIAQCNALSNAMPFLFEHIDDETELLLPDNLLLTDSVVAKLVEAIPEEDWSQVEIIGWLYQFYISEKKDQVIGKVVKSEDIPAATQLFTPNWIVQYLVQNSIGRLWLMANPASTLKSQWPYYIEPAEQTPEVQIQLDALIQTRIDEDSPLPEGEGPGVRGSLNPEIITVLDPACGSGHILVEAYEVLKAIYLERGYQPRNIPRLILEKNLFGLDIDDRAAQLAGFALLMKARADDRRLFDNPPKLNVLALQESKGLDADDLAQALLSYAALTRLTITTLIDTFAHAKTFGSLIQISSNFNTQLSPMDEELQLAIQSGDILAQDAALNLLPLVRQAQILGMKFDAVVANPPYMGGKGMAPSLKQYASRYYKRCRPDLYAMFVERATTFAKQQGGNVSFVTMHSWMFLPSFEEFRRWLIENGTFENMAHLGARAFSEISGEVVQSTAFSYLTYQICDYRPTFIDATDGEEEQKQTVMLGKENRHSHISQSQFQQIPGSPIAYWVTSAVARAFGNKRLSEFSEIKSGIGTSNNDRFLRFWNEVNFDEIGFGCSNIHDSIISKKKWFPYTKGGRFRKWYGNNEFIVNWEGDGREIKAAVVNNPSDPNTTHWSRRIFNTEYFFLPSITWSDIGGGLLSVRKNEKGCIHDAVGVGAYRISQDVELEILAALNSCVAMVFVDILCPTLHFKPGQMGEIPIILPSSDVGNNASECVALAKQDWNANETSWSFDALSWCVAPFKANNIQQSWNIWARRARENIERMRSLENDNNRLFIEAYSLQDELSPKVPEDQITLARPDREKDCQRLISYAIGCMMGRYRLDRPGLIYAHAGNIDFDKIYYGIDTPPFEKGGPGGIFQFAQAESQEQIPPNPPFSKGGIFAPDADGIVPITDELWFEDDAANRIREFLLAVWGAETLDENLAWLAESLGQKTNETPQETIRRYLAGSFFKDHLQTYKKRPIYWLFSSGKQGAFQALVYLHRYHEGTLARMRAEYVVPLTGKIQSRIEMLEKDAAAASSNAARNKLNKDIEKLKKKHVELLAYDEKLRHYADLRIQLDLDDGVKVNYGKFGDLLAEVKAVTGGASDD